VRGSNQNDLIRVELQSLINEKKAQSLQKSVGWLDLISQTNLRRRLFVVLGLHIAQQFSGINAV